MREIDRPWAGWTLVTWLGLLLLQPAFGIVSALSQGPPDAEVEEEDIPVFGAESVSEEEVAKLEQMFTEAEEVFHSAQQPRSVALFGDVITRVDQYLTRGELPAELRKLLVRSLFLRSEAQFNLGQNDAAEADLRRLLQLEPDYQVDTSIVSPKLARLLESLRRQMVGYVDFALQPEDARVVIDGELIESEEIPLALLEGEHDLAIERAGHEPVVRSLRVQAGKRQTVTVSLERTSAVVRLCTRPSGVTVLLDGEPVATTTGTAGAGFLPEGEAARYPPEEFSAYLAVGGLEVGEHELELQKEGYRSRRVTVQVEELVDYALEPAVLEAARGTLVLLQLPEGAEVTVDGETQVPAPAGTGWEVELPPGEHDLVVVLGTVGRYEHRFALEDLGRVEVEVKLGPVVTMLGILGGDRVAAGSLLLRLQDSFAGRDGWVMVDCIDQGPELLEQAGVGVLTLRRLAEVGMSRGDTPDWAAVQTATDGSCPGSVYLLGVLSDDLYATDADLWLWSAAPGPARPERRRIALQQTEDVEKVLAAFSAPLQVARPWLGAQVVDSLAAPAPVVIAVAAQSPAAEAGLQLGDRIVAVDGEPVTSSRGLEERVEGHEPGSLVTLSLQRTAETRDVEVELASSPAVISLEDPDLLYPVVSAKLTVELAQSEGLAPEWVLRLNRAAVMLKGAAWREAVTQLRAIEAPVGPGLGQGAVDYWLGVALLATDPATYGASARASLQRALEVPGARLYHNDGPLVAPRARARLEELGGSR